MAEMAVREADHQPMQFELMIHGQARFYRCQAASLDIQQMWVKEIRRLLQAQFSLMKGAYRCTSKDPLMLLHIKGSADVIVYMF